MKKATKALVAERVSEAEKLMLLGYQHSRVVESCALKWELRPKTVEKYIGKVYEKWERETEKRKPHTRSAQVNRLYLMLEEAATSEKIRIESLIADIEGNKAPVKNENTGESTIRMIVEDLRS